MTQFLMPLDITGEEKMIGGVLSLRQIGYIACAIILIFIGCMFPVPMILKIIFGVLLLFMFLALAFIKVDTFPNFTNGISLDKYIMLYIRYRRMQKIYVWEA